jgi:AraC-like DNA-binding protein
MPYQRHLHIQTPQLKLESARLVEPQMSWSSWYESDALHRYVIPKSSYFEVRTGQRSALVDACTAWLLPARCTYSMRKPLRQDSFVIAMNDCDDDAASEQPTAAAGTVHLRNMQPGQLAVLHRIASNSPHQDDVLWSEEALSSLISTLRTQPRLAALRLSARAQKAASQARELIAAAPGTNLSLSELGHRVALSGYQLARCFSALYGVSLHQHRTRLRMAVALARLSQLKRGECDLTQIALDLGYSSHSHFSAAFKRTVGCTPSAAIR